MFKIIPWHRLIVVITLDHVTAHAVDEEELIIALHAFGQGFDPQLLCHMDDIPQDDLILP